MEENQLSQNVESIQPEPDNQADNSENSKTQSNLSKVEDKSSDPSTLILGKFKSTEDLTEAYKQLEKLQGNQSSELGMLRERMAAFNLNDEALNAFKNVYENREIIRDAVQKYPEYFADPSFKQIYTEAYKALGNDLDVDRLVNLIESYTSARIFAHEKSKAAEVETQKTIHGMKFDKNDKIVTTPVRKSIQQMTSKELDEMLDRLI